MIVLKRGIQVLVIDQAECVWLVQMFNLAPLVLQTLTEYTRVLSARNQL
jgi:hypothetical protein